MSWRSIKRKRGVAIGRALGLPNIAIPAGIRHHFRVSRRTTQTANWNREVLKGLTYICTEKGPQRGWLHKIGS